jgi:hypothetical protein
MAKVMNPLMSSEARGRVGGHVYNTWRGIHTVKTQTAPDHEDDPKRQAHKAIVQAVGISWQSIEPEQRAAWNHFANEHPDIDWTGTPKRLAGYHWYVRCNTRRQDIGLMIWPDPPEIPNNAYYFYWNSDGLPGEIDSDWVEANLDPEMSYFADIWMTKPLSAGRSPTIHDAYRNGITSIEDEAWVITGLAPGYYTLFYRILDARGLASPWLKTAPLHVT